ncbi:hypothetical protein L6452_06125 [Arctium lappa]|uniref:Uncharacterized protein n=1 Tax=Arctium lappa TaxID=4217 RepID=A0ACB9EHQ1_ARCLA|nr:hypothetical protein L6452_06125 [Arctium lappa]
MSGRHRMSESLWDKKEEKMPPAEIGRKILWQAKDLHSSVCRDSSPKWSNSEASDGMMPSSFSVRPSWEPLQGNGKVPKDDDINRGRHRTQTDPTFDEWEKQYSTRPSDGSYGLPYRGPDRGVGRSACMSRNRSGSTYRSRSRGRGKGTARGVSRSRSRGRDWESRRARSRSPFCDDRQESIEYADIRNYPRMSSRPCKDFAAGDCRKGSRCRFFHQEILNSRGGGKQLDNNMRESWSRTPDYSGDSRYNDNGNSSDRWRNMGSDGYKKDTRLDVEVKDIAKDFMEGRCHRGASCRFPHHVASGDDYHRDDRNLYDDQALRRHSNRTSRLPCKFFSAGKCNRDDCKFSHGAPESGRYDGRSHDNIWGHNLVKKNWTRNDQQSHDDLNASDFSDIAKSNFGDKNKSWSGPLWDEVESGGFDERSHVKIQGHASDDRNGTWDCPVSGDASGFSDVVNSKHNSDDNKKLWNGPSWDDVDTAGFPNAGKSNSNLDDKNRSWNGPSWNEVNASSFSNVSKPCRNSEDSKKSWNGTTRCKISALGYGAKFGNNIGGETKPWNGPLWDEVSESSYFDVGKSTGGDGTSAAMLQIGSKTSKWDGPGLNEKAVEKNEYLLPQWTSVTKGTGVGSKQISSMDDQELQLLPAGLQSHTLDGNAQHVRPQALDSRLANATTATLSEVPGASCNQKNQGQGEHDVVIVVDDSDASNANMPSEDANQQILTSGEDSIQGVHDMNSKSLSYLNGTEKSHDMLLSNCFNGPKVQLNGQVQGMFLHMDSQRQMEIQNKDGVKPLNYSEVDVPQVMKDMNETSVNSELTPQVNGLPVSLPEFSQKEQLPQVYTELNLANAIDFLKSLPNSASSGPYNDHMVFPYNQDAKPKEQHNSARSIEVSKFIKTSVPMGILSGSVRQENQMPLENFPPISTGGPNSCKLGETSVMQKKYSKSPKTKKQEPVGNPEVTDSRVGENAKQEQENISPDNSEAQGKVEEGNISNDEKAMRQFKMALVEFVKEILKPTWKEGKMSREVHKTVVKKVIDKVTSTIQGIQVPRTQGRIEQYLTYSKPKIAKLVELCLIPSTWLWTHASTMLPLAQW